MRYRFKIRSYEITGLKITALKMTGMACGLALLSACQTAPPANKYLHAEARPLIKEVDSVLISKQNTVGTDIKTSKISQYVQGHIIPVLFDIGVNSIRTSKAKKLVTPMRDTLSDYDYTADIKEEFNRALTESGLEGAGELTVIRQEPQGFRAGLIQHSRADAVMFVDVKYAFTPKFDTLNLTSSVLLYPLNPALDPYKEKPDTDRVIEYSDNIYRNNFMASIPARPESAGEGEGEVEDDEDASLKTSENAALWAAMSEEELTGKLQEAASKLANHIAADLSVDELPEIEVRAEDDDEENLTTEPIIIDASLDE